jgi:hypothetical protein
MVFLVPSAMLSPPVTAAHHPSMLWLMSMISDRAMNEVSTPSRVAATAVSIWVGLRRSAAAVHCTIMIARPIRNPPSIMCW